MNVKSQIAYENSSLRHRNVVRVIFRDLTLQVDDGLLKQRRVWGPRI